MGGHGHYATPQHKSVKIGLAPLKAAINVKYTFKV
jgi:hypothetical protein